jgi:hypothetical protein
MHSKLPQRNDPHNLLAQQTLYGPADGKNPTYLGNSSAFRNVFKTLQHPPLIPVKRAFDKIFKGVYSKKDLALSENQPSSEPFNTLQTNPSESQTNSIYNDAAQATTSTAPVIHNVDEDEDSDRTPSPPPQKFESLINKNLSTLEPSPEPEENQQNDDQNEPHTPPPENNQNNPPLSPPIVEQIILPTDSLKTPEPKENINPNSEVSHKPKSPVINVEKSPQNVAVDNTLTVVLPTNNHPLITPPILIL